MGTSKNLPLPAQMQGLLRTETAMVAVYMRIQSTAGVVTPAQRSSWAAQ